MEGSLADLIPSLSELITGGAALAPIFGGLVALTGTIVFGKMAVNFITRKVTAAVKK